MEMRSNNQYIFEVYLNSDTMHASKCYWICIQNYVNDTQYINKGSSAVLFLYVFHLDFLYNWSKLNGILMNKLCQFLFVFNTPRFCSFWLASSEVGGNWPYTPPRFSSDQGPHLHGCSSQICIDKLVLQFSPTPKKGLINNCLFIKLCQVYRCVWDKAGT